MNNKRKFVEYIISILILLIFILANTITTYATTKSELQNEKSDIDDQIEEKNSEIASVKSQMSDTLVQINNYNSQISSYEDEIDTLQSQIDLLEGQISEKENNIIEQENKYQEQQELLNKRLVAMYESGSTSYLDMLLSSDSISDFISKYYIIEQLTEYDTELLQTIQNTKIQIENEKQDLENSKNEIESSKITVQSKKNSLSTIVNEKNSLVTTLSDEEKSLESELEQFEKDKREIQAQLEKIAAEEEAARKAAAAKNSANTSVVSSPSTAGFICPIAGKSKSNITTGYYGYSGHTGVDFACSSGTSIMAAKAGTVVISTALKYSNGNYRSYGEYIVISHGDGTMTLYAHMSAGTRRVSVGESVSQGQVIGQVGSTGNSTGPHLHFEVRVNGKCVNPTAYLP